MLTTLVLFIYQNIVGRELTIKEKDNYLRLAQAFPEIAVAFISWFNNGEEFMKRVERGFKNE